MQRTCFNNQKSVVESLGADRNQHVCNAPSDKKEGWRKQDSTFDLKPLLIPMLTIHRIKSTSIQQMQSYFTGPKGQFAALYDYAAKCCFWFCLSYDVTAGTALKNTGFDHCKQPEGHTFARSSPRLPHARGNAEKPPKHLETKIKQVQIVCCVLEDSGHKATLIIIHYLLCSAILNVQP